MKKIVLLLTLFYFSILPVSAVELQPPEVPQIAEEYMPEDPESFSEGLWFVIKKGIEKLQPAIAQSAGTCLSIICIVLLCSVIDSFSGQSKQIVSLISALVLGVVMFYPSNNMIQMGISVIEEMTSYGKLLVPVMTSAMAAQGGFTSSAALYSGTMLFNTILSTAIFKLVLPCLYVYICLAVATSVLTQAHLHELQKFFKWLITWILKIVLYVFTGYMSITGVVSGSVDASAIKATKITLSGVVPVIGNLISDASETILVSAGLIKNSIGVYGLLAILSVLIGPFLQIGVQYLLLKLTGSVCGIFGIKQSTDLIKNFSTVMGMILGCICTVALLLMVSTVCFMRGISG